MPDVIIRNGQVFDGSGQDPWEGDVALEGDRIAAVDFSAPGQGRSEINAEGLAITPGFINMLSWAGESLLLDGRSLSDMLQGVTLEVFGEGRSMGPLTDGMKTELLQQQEREFAYDIAWTTLAEYLQHLEEKGVSPNVASFVAATTLRIHELGYENRSPSSRELTRMQGLVSRARQEGLKPIASDRRIGVME